MPLRPNDPARRVRGERAANKALRGLLDRPAPPVSRSPGAVVPNWPSGTVGSVSHTDTVSAAVAMVSAGETIGVDIEPCTRPGGDRAGHALCSERELREIARVGMRPLGMFCAKEAAFKALWPLATMSLEDVMTHSFKLTEYGTFVLRAAAPDTPRESDVVVVLGQRHIAAIAVTSGATKT